jgi:hypothetical protein
VFARERCVKELSRVEALVANGSVTIAEALAYAFALGEECSREDTMHRACMGFSEARAARERMMRSFTSPPSAPRP